MSKSDITVTSLTQIPEVRGIKLAWTTNDPRNGSIPNIALGVVEVWAATSNDRSVAEKVGEAETNFLQCGLDRGTVLYYWARARNKIGSHGDFYPASPTGGVVGSEYNPGALIAESGYVRGINGLIEQWGRDDLTGGDSSTTITFPIAFPNQCFQVIACSLAPPVATKAFVIHVETFDASTVLLSGNEVSSGGGGIVTAPPMTALWRAIGY